MPIIGVSPAPPDTVSAALPHTRRNEAERRCGGGRVASAFSYLIILWNIDFHFRAIAGTAGN
jgi:hypothetical protein